MKPPKGLSPARQIRVLTVFHVTNSLTSGPHVNIHVVIETVAWGSTSEHSSISGRFVISVDLCYAAGYLGMSILQEP